MTSLLLNGFYASTLSTFHWLSIAVLGVVAKKIGFVDSKFKSGLSKVVTNIILPFFIFAQIVNNFRKIRGKEKDAAGEGRFRGGDGRLTGVIKRIGTR